LTLGYSATFNVKRDAIIGNAAPAVLRTTGAGSNLVLNADSDGDGVGGVFIRTAGQVVSAGTLTVSGADVFATAATVDGVAVENDGANDQLRAAGAVSISTTASAPAGADVVLAGRVTATGAGNIA